MPAFLLRRSLLRRRSLHLLPFASAQTPATLPSETPASLQADGQRLRLRPPRSHDPDARRGQAAHRHPGAEGRKKRSDPAHADALQRNRADDEHAELAPRLEPLRLRQRDRRHRRRRLHPRHPGRPRQVRLRGRLRDEPPAARPAEPDAGRPCHRHLRHHRLAGKKHSGEQRQGRHHRHLLRRIHHR